MSHLEPLSSILSVGKLWGRRGVEALLGQGQGGHQQQEEHCVLG